MTNYTHNQALGLYRTMDWKVIIKEALIRKTVYLSDARQAVSFFQPRYLPLALGQKAPHLPLIEGLGGSAGQRGERGHPWVGEGLGTWQSASGVWEMVYYFSRFIILQKTRKSSNSVQVPRDLLFIILQSAIYCKWCLYLNAFLSLS